jgi:tetratricopeptide (TPR) repeat protein
MSNDPLKDIAKAVALGVAVTYGLNKLDARAERERAERAATPSDPGEQALTVCFVTGLLTLSGLVILLADPTWGWGLFVVLLFVVSVVSGSLAWGIISRQTEEERLAAGGTPRELQAKIDEATRLVEMAEHAEPKERCRLLAKAHELLPDVLELRLTLLSARLEAGRGKALERQLRERLEAGQKDRVTRLELATTLAWLKRHNEALAIFRRMAPRVKPTRQFGWAFFAWYGAALLASGDARGALEAVQLVLRRKRTLEDTYVQKCLLVRGMAQAELGRKAAARRDLDRLWAANPEMPGLAQVRAEFEEVADAAGAASAA